MKASGCPYKKRNCEFPKDKHADIIPISVESKVMKYYVDWDASWRQPPIELRRRKLCPECWRDVDKYLRDLCMESKAIETYYSRKEKR